VGMQFTQPATTCRLGVWTQRFYQSPGPTTHERFKNLMTGLSEENCLQYISKLRWPKGFQCPACGATPENPSLIERGLFLCRQCKRQNFYYGRNIVSQDSQTASHLVSRHVCPVTSQSLGRGDKHNMWCLVELTAYPLLIIRKIFSDVTLVATLFPYSLNRSAKPVPRLFVVR